MGRTELAPTYVAIFAQLQPIAVKRIERDFFGYRHEVRIWMIGVGGARGRVVEELLVNRHSSMTMIPSGHRVILMTSIVDRRSTALLELNQWMRSPICGVRQLLFPKARCKWMSRLRHSLNTRNGKRSERMKSFSPSQGGGASSRDTDQP